jgi:hypothetical protein
VCLPFLLLPAWLSWRAGQLKGGTLLTGAAMVLAGASVYAMLPLRARFQPMVNLGNPADWDNFWFVVLRKGYSQKQWADTPGILQNQLGQWWGFIWREGSFLMPLAGGLGAWSLYRSAFPSLSGQDPQAAKAGRCLLAVLVGIFWGIFFAVVVYNRNEPATVWLMEVFLIPGQACLAIFAGLGLAKIFGSSPALARLSPMAPALLLALLWSSFLRYENRRGDFFYWDFGNDILFSLPVDAVYIPEGDFYYMPLYYNKGVEKRRADTALLHKNMLSTWPGLNDLARQKPGFKIDLTPGNTVLQCLLRDNLARFPFVVGTYHTSVTQADLGAMRREQRGVLQQILPPLAPALPAALGTATGPRFDGIPVSSRDLFVKNMVRWYKDSYFEQLRGLGAFDPPRPGAKAPPEEKRELIRKYRILLTQVVKQMER